MGCTSWKLRRAVLPISSLSWAVSDRPGTCTRMRLVPSRTILGSVVPMASTRRRTVSMAAEMALPVRCRSPASVGVMVMLPPSPWRHVDIGPEVPNIGLPSGCTISFRALRAASLSSALAIAHLHGVAGDADRADADLGLAQSPPRIVTQAIEPVLADVIDLHRQQQMRAAAQVETEVQLLGRAPSAASDRASNGKRSWAAPRGSPTRQVTRIAICFQRLNVSMLALCLA